MSHRQALVINFSGNGDLKGLTKAAKASGANGGVAVAFFIKNWSGNLSFTDSSKLVHFAALAKRFGFVVTEEPELA